MTNVTTPANTSGNAKPAAPKLSDAQWAEIVTKWELGTHNSTQLTAEYGVSASAMSMHFKRHNITKGSKKPVITAAVTAAAVQAATTAQVEQQKFAEQRIERIEETRQFYYATNEMVAKITAKKVQDAFKSSTPIAALDGEFKALRRVTQILAETRRERWVVLAADSIVDAEEELPELAFAGLLESEIEKMQNADDDIDGIDIDLDIDGVKIGEDDEIVVED